MPSSQKYTQGGNHASQTGPSLQTSFASFLPVQLKILANPVLRTPSKVMPNQSLKGSSRATEKGGAANLLRLLGKELGHRTSLGLLSVDLYASRDKEGGAAGGFIRLKLDGRLSSFQHSPQQNSAS